MRRVPEAELMDELEQARAYAQADFSEAHQKVVTIFEQRFGAARGEALDLGCGPGDVTMRFARAFPELHLLGVDGSDTMLAEGYKAVAAAGLGGRIRLERHFLPDPALPGQAFDVVISNSLLHHLADPLVLWQTVRQTARPGAPVLIVDLLRPASEAEAQALAAEHAAGAPEMLARDFYNSLLAAYSLDEVRQQLAASGLASFEVAATDALHWAAWGRAPKAAPVY